MNPCNAGIQPLIDRAVAELEAIGAKATNGRRPDQGSDAIRNGNRRNAFLAPIAGRYLSQLPNRRRQSSDGRRLLHRRGCDKNKPGAVIGMLFANVPAIHVDAGTIQARKVEERRQGHCPPRFRSVGEVSAGRLSREDFEGIERNACPGVGVVWESGSIQRTLWLARSPRLAPSLINSPLLAAKKIRKSWTRSSNPRTCSRMRSRWTSSRATSRHPKVHLECGRNSHGDAQGSTNAGTSHSCHCESGSRQMDIGRLRGRSAEGARSMRSKAIGPLYGGGFSSRRRRRGTGAADVCSTMAFCTVSA